MKAFDPEAIFAHDMAFAERVLLLRGEVHPMFVIHGEKGSLVVGTGWASDEDKAIVLKIVHTLAVAENAHALSTMTEAWAVRGAAATADHELGVMPRNSAHRVEIVHVLLVYREGGKLHHLASMRDIVRDAEGKPTGLLPDSAQDMSRAEMGGAFADLLQQRPPDPREREVARGAIEAVKHLMPGAILPVSIPPTTETVQ